MIPTELYIKERDKQVLLNQNDTELRTVKHSFTTQLVRTNHIKNFIYLGIPVLQYATDLMVMQELIWQIKPDYVIETGVAFGGSLVFYASILKALGHGMAIGIDIDIREPNRQQIAGHPLSRRIMTIQGDSTDKATLRQLRYMIGDYRKLKILVVLDSLHTHAHVLKELEIYSELVSVGSYLIVQDTAIEFYGHLDKNQDRPWGEGNNPWSAVMAFLKTEAGKNFVIDKDVETRALITGAIDGWLRRIE